MGVGGVYIAGLTQFSRAAIYVGWGLVLGNVYQLVNREETAWVPKTAHHYGVTIHIHVLSSLMS